MFKDVTLFSICLTAINSERHGRIRTRATWLAAQRGASMRAAKMRVYVHFSSKFLNINFQYLKTKNLDLLYYESY